MPDVPARSIDLGSHLRLWTHDMGGVVDDLVLTSHGISMSRPWANSGAIRNVPLLGGALTVPKWTNLVFYGPHKKVLEDPGITNLMNGTAKHFEIKSGGESVKNYRLTFYEHDTDDIIKSRVELNREYVQIINELKANNQELPPHIQAMASLPKFDVIRVVQSGIKGTIGYTLKDVLAQLDKHGYHYKNIHCVFCRGTSNQAFGELASGGRYEGPSHNASNN